MKKTLHRGGFETLNVYTNLAGGFLGYAYLPGLPDSHLWQDGIVLNWESMPGRLADVRRAGTTSASPLVHEAGHWFNLEHTFFGGCNAKGDFVDDTPPMREPTSRLSRGQGHLRASRGSTRSTTTWTTRTTPATRSSRPVRSRACRTRGSSTGPRTQARGRFGGPSSHAPGRIRTSDLSLRRRALYPLSYGRPERSVYRRSPRRSDPRTTSSTGRTSAGGGGLLGFDHPGRAQSRRPLLIPNLSCFTVVSGGSACAASGASSKPTTATSSGTERPSSRAARMTPSAIMSLAAKTAVGLFVRAEQDEASR